MPASFTLSAFGDEIAAALQDQVEVLRDLRVGYLELRSAWGKNVLHLHNDEVASVARICAESGVSVSCIGSPVAKSSIQAPIAHELANLSRIFQIADALDTRLVRIFSFYPPPTVNDAHANAYVDQAVSRLVRLAQAAERAGFLLLLENEKAIVGDTLARCRALLSGVDNPHLRFLWDPANFVQVGEARPTQRGWPLLGPYVAHVHVKDAQLADGTIRPAGEGDGEIPELLRALRDARYQGFLALEPHLAIAGHSSGFSGPDGMARAVTALRHLMAKTGCLEQSPG